MTSTPCVLAFDTKQKERKQYPLRSGKYKLDEVGRTLDKILRGFDNIVDYRNGKNRQPYGQVDLGGFQACEMHTRLRNIPRMLAELLGYDIQPSGAALAGDCVSAPIVTREVQKLNAFTGQFLSDCDAAHVLLEGPISAEYARLKDGSSDLVWLTQRLKAQVEILLDLCDRETV
jgi:hypothetical protein